MVHLLNSLSRPGEGDVLRKTVEKEENRGLLTSKEEKALTGDVYMVNLNALKHTAAS